jgi:hypothetical protein
MFSFVLVKPNQKKKNKKKKGGIKERLKDMARHTSVYKRLRKTFQKDESLL